MSTIRFCPRTLGVLLALLGALALPISATANNLSTLDAQAVTNQPSSVALDSAGNVYVTWDRESALGLSTPMFCKFPLGSRCQSPIALSLPGSAATDGQYVLLCESTVYVVGPRDADADVVVWASTDGGAPGSFNGAVIANDDEEGDTDGALLAGTNLLLAGDDHGLYFDSTPISGPGAPGFTFTNPGVGGVAAHGATLALDPDGNPVEAYWNLSTPAALSYYFTTSSDLGDEADWTGPVSLGDGQSPALGGNSAGLYLLSADGSGATIPDEPTALDVRRYDAAIHTFGTPVTLGGSPDLTFDERGALAVTPGGTVVAVFPQGGAGALDAWISPAGGARFSAPIPVAAIDGTYGEQIALAATGTASGGVQGVVLYADGGGLELADLTPVSAPPPPPAPAAPAATTISTTQTLGPAGGSTLRITAGAIGESDSATISGTDASRAGGVVTYGLYRSSTCAAWSAVFHSSVAVSGGVAAGSGPVEKGLSVGSYYWQSAYSGDATNQGSANACGSNVLRVISPLSLPRSASSDGRTVTASVGCAAALPCAGNLVLAVTQKKRVIGLGSGKLNVPAHRTTRVTVRLTARGRSLLAAHRDHLAAALDARVDTDSGVQPYRRTVTITKARSARHRKR
ncbi:MAG TPA: hypothetical protein VHX88_10015 [Solirubrobacteraceae bacterium]|jgi:hypothetical protein|nr:hypothetical protein [Solirubrobacteraceae bacterium]